MKISINIAIASHLSDAQELMALGCTTDAQRQINYAKAILFKHPDTTGEVSEEELDEICHKVDQRFANR